MYLCTITCKYHVWIFCVDIAKFRCQSSVGFQLWVCVSCSTAPPSHKLKSILARHTFLQNNLFGWLYWTIPYCMYAVGFRSDSITIICELLNWPLYHSDKLFLMQGFSWDWYRYGYLQCCRWIEQIKVEILTIWKLWISFFPKFVFWLFSAYCSHCTIPFCSSYLLLLEISKIPIINLLW